MACASGPPAAQHRAPCAHDTHTHYTFRASRHDKSGRRNATDRSTSTDTLRPVTSQRAGPRSAGRGLVHASLQCGRPRSGRHTPPRKQFYDSNSPHISAVVARSLCGEERVHRDAWTSVDPTCPGQIRTRAAQHVTSGLASGSLPRLPSPGHNRNLNGELWL